MRTEIGSFKDHPVLEIYTEDGFKILALGKRKAKYCVLAINQIKDFAEV